MIIITVAQPAPPDETNQEKEDAAEQRRRDTMEDVIAGLFGETDASFQLSKLLDQFTYENQDDNSILMTMQKPQRKDTIVEMKGVVEVAEAKAEPTNTADRAQAPSEAMTTAPEEIEQKKAEEDRATEKMLAESFITSPRTTRLLSVMKSSATDKPAPTEVPLEGEIREGTISKKKYSRRGTWGMKLFKKGDSLDHKEEVEAAEKQVAVMGQGGEPQDKAAEGEDSKHRFKPMKLIGISGKKAKGSKTKSEPPCSPPRKVPSIGTHIGKIFTTSPSASPDNAASPRKTSPLASVKKLVFGDLVIGGSKKEETSFIPVKARDPTTRLHYNPAYRGGTVARRGGRGGSGVTTIITVTPAATSGSTEGDGDGGDGSKPPRKDYMIRRKQQLGSSDEAPRRSTAPSSKRKVSKGTTVMVNPLISAGEKGSGGGGGGTRGNGQSESLAQEATGSNTRERGVTGQDYSPLEGLRYHIYRSGIDTKRTTSLPNTAATDCGKYNSSCWIQQFDIPPSSTKKGKKIFLDILRTCEDIFLLFFLLVRKL